MKRFWTRYPLDPRDKSTGRRRVLLALTAACLLCAAFCLGTVSLLFGALYFNRLRLLSYFQTPMLAFLNIFPVVLLVFFLYFLTNRAWIAFLLSSALVLLASFVNYFKVVLRDDCFVFEDLKLIGAAAGIAGEYDFDLGGWFLAAIAACLFGTVFLFFVCRGRLPSWRWKLGGAAVILAVSLASYKLWYDDAVLYSSLQNYKLFNQWQPTEKYAAHGFVYPFLYSIRDSLQPAPEGYSAKAAQDSLDEYPAADIPEDGKVNVIAVMLESFSDFSLFDSIDFAADPYEPLRAIWAESEKGTLISDTMGGGTINAERSFLTGFAYPHPSYRRATYSYVRYLTAQGYAAEGAHPGHEWFYNRESVNANLGFDRYFFKESLFDCLTGDEYAQDDIFFPAVRQLYDGRDKSKPYFSFSVSYQNHSPYASDVLSRSTIYVNRGDLADTTFYTVNNYLSGVADTARHAASFAESFRDEAEPVVLVFFGDHKPTLGAGNACYEELGVNMDRGTQDGFENYYATPYWIWMNDAAKALLGDPAGEGPTISPCYLMREVFDCCGWTGPSFSQFLTEAEETLPVVQSTGVCRENGEYTKEISENSQKLLEKFRIMQYYLRKKTQK